MTSDMLINESECYDIYLLPFIISTTLLHVSVQCDWCVWQWCCMLYGISGSEAVHSGRPQWSSQCGTEPTSSPPCPDLRTLRRLTAGEAPSVWEVSVVTSHQSRSGSVLLLGKHLTSASLLLTRWCVNIVIHHISSGSEGLRYSIRRIRLYFNWFLSKTERGKSGEINMINSDTFTTDFLNYFLNIKDNISLSLKIFLFHIPSKIFYFKRFLSQLQPKDF